MKKPVRKRKGYDSGGYVSTAGDQLADTWNRSDKSPETSERYIAARNAQTSAMANERGSKTAAGDTRLWGSGKSGSHFQEGGRTVELGRADYPGFKKGGKVKKVIAVKRKR